MTPAVAYYRTSSATNVTGDSEKRQRDAIHDFAFNTLNRLEAYDIKKAFYDAAVSGTDPVDGRPAFAEMLKFVANNDIKVVLVENASRFARDLAVQLAGHAMLKARGIELIPVDAPTYFTDPSPTAELVRQILGAVAQFEKAALVAKLKHARDAKRQATGRCEGRKPNTAAVIYAQQLKEQNPEITLLEISAELTHAGYVSTAGSYSVSAISRMLRS